jgi:hypothetical protein
MLFMEHTRLVASAVTRNGARQILKISLEYYLGHLVVES